MNSKSSAGLKLFGLVLSATLFVGCEGEEEGDDLRGAVNAGAEEVISIEVASPDKTRFEPGETWQLAATATRKDETTFDVTGQVSWSTSDGQLATVNGSGLFKAGTAEAIEGSPEVVITANWAGFSDTTNVIVSDAQLVSISVNIADNPVDECRSTTLSAAGQYDDGLEPRPLETSDLTWNVSDGNLARVDSESGTVVTMGSGSVQVTANRGSVSSTAADLTITDSLTEITFTDGTDQTVGLNSSKQLTTTGNYGGTSTDITSATSWSVESNPTAITLSEAGVVRGNTAGQSATVSASCGGLNSTATIEVIGVTGIQIISPSSDRLEPGDEIQLELYRVFGRLGPDNNDIAEDDDVRWWIEDDEGDDIATINSDTGELTMAESFEGYDRSSITVNAEFTDEDNNNNVLSTERNLAIDRN